MKMMVPGAALLLVLLTGAPGAQAQAHDIDFHAMAQERDRTDGSGGLFKGHDVDFHEMGRKAVQKSVPLLQKGATAWIERSNGACFSCHNQSLPVMATGLARERGYSVDKNQEREVAEYVYRFFAEGKEALQKALADPKADHQVNRKLADPVIVVGYALATLQAAEWPADETTGAMARFLAHRQAPEGRWRVPAARPPHEGSEFTATALAIRGLQTYMPKERARERTERIARARAWLVATPPKTTEDKAFRLFGLRWANASPKVIRKAVHGLLAEQRDDGGWAQLPHLASDAYATGQVLVALHQAGGLPTRDAAYSRGSLFLVGTQKEDGSWFVQPRAVTFNPYFDAGFPHEKAQFISCAGSSWATMALALAAPGEAVPGAPKAALKGPSPH